jgi:branched-chain amino acid transport system ATP-binding protein
VSGTTPGGSPAVLEVDGIDVRFDGVVALDGVSLTVHANQIVGVIGPNGAGKTTLFNAISRFVTPVAGTITYQGKSLLGLPASRVRCRASASGRP